MSVLGNSLLLGAEAAGPTAYQVSRSLRFNSADSASCSRAFTSTGNRRTWTWAAWIKRSAVSFSAEQHIWGVTGTTDATYGEMFFGTGDTLRFAVGYNTVYGITTTRVFRDPGAWFHVVLAFDATQSTAANKIKLYINGVEETTFSSDTRSSLANQDWGYNNNVAHYIGRNPNSDIRQFNGYLADIHFIDGQALTPSSFAETDATTGQWIPKLYSGSYGTNGFKLNFSDNSAATAAALGKDSSGNSNNFTPNNFTVVGTNNYTITGYDATNGRGAFANITLPASGDGTNAYHYPRSNSTYTISPTITATTKIEAYCYVDGSSGPTIQANGGSAINIPAGSSYAWAKVNLGVTSLSSITLNASNWSGRDFWLSCFIVDDVVVTNASVLGPYNDSLVDTPTSISATDTGIGGEIRGNYCTLNPLANGGTLSNGNLDATSGINKVIYSTIALDSGKYYWEVTLNGSAYQQIGIADITKTNTTNTAPGDSGRNGYVYLTLGYTYNNGTLLSSSYASSTTGDVIGIAYDGSSNKLWLRKNNGSWFGGGDPAAGTSPTMTTSTSYTYTPVLGAGGADAVNASCNFGQRSWAYQAPAGFKALVDTNLTAPVVAKPSTVMDVALWTGTGVGGRAVTGLNFNPDLVWLKRRSSGGANSHQLHDAVRGATTGALYSDLTNAEDSNYPITSFNSAGFTLGSSASLAAQSYASQNESSQTYVGWCWDAGTSTVTNTQGSITSQVRANASAGFSIVTYTGTGANATVGHGLGVAPRMIIIKDRDAVKNWAVYHGSLSSNAHYLLLNTTDAQANTFPYWNGSPTSTVFTLGTTGGSNESGDKFVAYCFAPVSGYSSMGSYVGNGSTDGPFVFCGFRPRFLLAKSTGSGGWVIYDAARDTYNFARYELYPHTSNAEVTNDASYSFDFLSNGFKVRRAGDSSLNTNGQSVIWAAFAESPFQYARAR